MLSRGGIAALETKARDVVLSSFDGWIGAEVAGLLGFMNRGTLWLNV